MFFQDRRDAAKKLAMGLEKYKAQPEILVLAIPRGGVVIGYEIARILKLPLDIVVTKKIGAPGQEEFAIGAVNMDGAVMLNQEIISLYGIDQEYIKNKSQKIKKAVDDKLKQLRGNKPLPNLKNKTIILTDDGVATGYTVKAAIEFLRSKAVAKIVLAIPVAPPETAKELRKLVDELVVLETPIIFTAVGQFYQNFEQITDDECKSLLMQIS